MYDQVKARGLPGQIRAPRASASKLDRLAACTAILETGKFLLPAPAPWLHDFRSELLGFPEYPHDDQVDAFSQLVQFAFDSRRWVETVYDRGSGRPLTRLPRSPRRPSYYR